MQLTPDLATLSLNAVLTSITWFVGEKLLVLPEAGVKGGGRKVRYHLGTPV